MSRDLTLLRALLGLAVLLLAAGCAPNLLSYYRPEVPGLDPLRGGCGLKMEDGLRLDATGVELVLSYLPAAGERQSGLYMNIRVPARRRFAFANTAFSLHEEPGGAPIPVLSLDVLRDDGQRSVTAPYDAGDVALDDPGRANLRWYSLIVRTPDLDIPAFKVQWPPVIVDGATVTLPPVHFRRTTTMGIGPLNC